MNVHWIIHPPGFFRPWCMDFFFCKHIPHQIEKNNCQTQLLKRTHLLKWALQKRSFSGCFRSPCVRVSSELQVEPELHQDLKADQEESRNPHWEDWDVNRQQPVEHHGNSSGVEMNKAIRNQCAEWSWEYDIIWYCSVLLSFKLHRSVIQVRSVQEPCQKLKS